MCGVFSHTLEFKVKRGIRILLVTPSPSPWTHESVVSLIGGFCGDIYNAKFLTNQSFPVYSKEQWFLICVLWSSTIYTSFWNC